MLDTFPLGLFRPTSMRWRRVSVTNSGGRGANGITRIVHTDGGGLWRCEMTVNLFSVANIKAARAFLESLDGGATPILVPFYAKRESPYPLGVPGADVPFGDGSLFGDDASFGSDTIEVATTGPAALRATNISPTITAAGAFVGGEMFSIDHPTKGAHIYTITRIPEDGSNWRIRPPLREAVASGALLDFDNPKCVMRLVNAEEAMGEITPPYFSSLTLQFEESMDDVA